MKEPELNDDYATKRWTREEKEGEEGGRKRKEEERGV
jgi:hypothetical protein